MPPFKSDFLRTFVERGAYYASSEPWEELDTMFRTERVTAYIGFDCTAKSMHIGNLVQLMTLRRLQQAGHRPILLMGGGTTKAGDPSGKDETRLILTPEQINENKNSMLSGVRHLLQFGNKPTDAIMVDNAEWLDKLEYIPFLREVGRHFSVNRMLTMDSVRLRLEREQPMSFLEFNYSIMQAYDYTELYKRYGCRLQSCGSDQWGNVVSGIDLGRRMGLPQLFALSTPLITTASGAKMGKSVSGAVWLNKEMLSVYDYWQFWRNCEDGDVGKFLRLFTDLPLDEIARLEVLQGAELNEAKKILATEATAVLHGRMAADEAAATARRVFEEGASAEGLPTFALKLPDGVLNLAVATGLASSNSEARKLIANNGLRINDVAVSDPRLQVTASDLTPEGVLKLSSGKKKHVLVKPA
ncbi:MAG: tyrosine--tRNA ligase [Alphaproteobacteria bacterium]|nr:tyrosine--tRNA ligase [Alphaproteobacteria bacterium]MBL6939293.1 tyrosine--tRNA ligase [Alphaproteobacteria bacterium]MBL7096809.1 tyrosine--tRNA ligase [Alphaproteobacteria bacterium]